MDEQLFYVSLGGRVPEVYTLTAIKEFCRGWITERWEFDESVTIGTDWRNWPHAIE